jgi:hypothetical protein
MVPTHFMILKEFPLLTNGKINRRALPDPVVRQEGISTQPLISRCLFINLHSESQPFLGKSVSSVEEILRNMWAQLNVHVTRNNQSFYEAGGSSLVAMQFLYLNRKTIFFTF